LAPSKHNLLGSQGFEAKMRMVVELRKDNIDHQKRHLCIVKGNYLPNEYKTKSYVLKFDENLKFTPTGERILFDELKANSNIEEKKKVLELKSLGKTQKEIATELKISQPTVSRILKDK
jgi:DNA-binding NarL/FixJ family response regulator